MSKEKNDKERRIKNRTKKSKNKKNMSINKKNISIFLIILVICIAIPIIITIVNVNKKQNEKNNEIGNEINEEIQETKEQKVERLNNEINIESNKIDAIEEEIRQITENDIVPIQKQLSELETEFCPEFLILSNKLSELELKISEKIVSEQPIYEKLGRLQIELYEAEFGDGIEE